jgi:hypothetical protein
MGSLGLKNGGIRREEIGAQSPTVNAISWATVNAS